MNQFSTANIEDHVPPLLNIPQCVPFTIGKHLSASADTFHMSCWSWLHFSEIHALIIPISLYTVISIRRILQFVHRLITEFSFFQITVETDSVLQNTATLISFCFMLSFFFCASHYAALIILLRIHIFLPISATR